MHPTPRQPSPTWLSCQVVPVQLCQHCVEEAAGQAPEAHTASQLTQKGLRHIAWRPQPQPVCGGGGVGGGGVGQRGEGGQRAEALLW